MGQPPISTQRKTNFANQSCFILRNLSRCANAARRWVTSREHLHRAGVGWEAKLNQLTQKTQCLAEFLAGGEDSMGVQIVALMAQQKQQAEKLALLEAARPVEAVAHPMSRKSKGKKGPRGL